MTLRCNAKGSLGPLTGRGIKRPAVDGLTFVEILVATAIICVLAGIVYMTYQSYIRKAHNAAAIADVSALQTAISFYRADTGTFPVNLNQLPTGNRIDPWGHHYQYLNIADDPEWHGKCRRDRKLNPLNTDFDLYSLGEDGTTKLPLTAKESQDDIVRANDGAFIGLGADY